MFQADMEPVKADLAKLRSLLDHGWTFYSIDWRGLSESLFRTTVLLKAGKRELELQSDDDEFFRFCAKQKVSVDENGDAAFRGIADLTRYHREAFDLAHDPEKRLKAAFQLVATGKVRLTFSPETLIDEFLRSKKWGEARFLPLKTQYFEVFACIALEGKRAADSEQRLRQLYPESARYANRIDLLLRKAFDPLNDPIKNYLRFTDINRADFSDLTKKLLDELAFNNDIFRRLAGKDGVEGKIGLRYVIDMYRRCMDWSTPLLKLVSDAVCIVEGKAPLDVSAGPAKRVEAIRQSSYSDIVDCVEPRIRNAASHNAISFDQDQGIVKVCGLDSDGNRKFADFELAYGMAADITRDFLRGFVPGIFCAFGMYRLLQLILTIDSGEYKRLMLLIDNVAPA